MSTAGLSRLNAEPSDGGQRSGGLLSQAPQRATPTPAIQPARTRAEPSAERDAVTRDTRAQAGSFVARASGLTADEGAVAAVVKRYGGELEPLKPFARELVRYGFASKDEQATMRSTWSRHVQALVRSSASDRGGATGLDVDGLVQWALQQSYMQSTDDLAFYAQKVKFFNQLKQAIRDELKAARSALTNMQGINVKDGVVTTPGGYQVVNNGGREWIIREPNGKEHRIWGDPHVDENSDGSSDWHFDGDGSFVLPDGTKIFCDTEKTGTLGAGDITVSDQVVIVYGDSMVTMDVTQAGNAEKSWGGVSWDDAHDDGQVFVLGDDHQWKDGATLGDLYDGGGDFVADINGGAKGTISAAAAAVLAGGVAGGAAGYVTKAFDGEPQFDATGSPLTQAHEGDTIYSRDELDNYIKSLEEKMSSVGDDAQLANVDLQNTLQTQQQTLQMMSNISKMLNDTAMATIRKIG